MGKGLVNLGNLKESMSIQPDSTVSGTFSASSQPVYIKTAAAAESQGQAKFIPGVFMNPLAAAQQQ
jgi:hypothetical protein